MAHLSDRRRIYQDHPDVKFVPGPFYMGSGWLGWTCNVICIVWTLFVSVLFSLPTYFPVTAENMNYASVITVGVIVFSLYVPPSSASFGILTVIFRSKRLWYFSGYVTLSTTTGMPPNSRLHLQSKGTLQRPCVIYRRTRTQQGFHRRPVRQERDRCHSGVGF